MLWLKILPRLRLIPLYNNRWKKVLMGRLQSQFPFNFFSPPVLMHGGLLGVAFCPSICQAFCKQNHMWEMSSQGEITANVKLHFS